jgi:hypothetical protein
MFTMQMKWTSSIVCFLTALAVKDIMCEGEKGSEECLAVLCCSNMDGSNKMKPSGSYSDLAASGVAKILLVHVNRTEKCG